MTAGSGRDALTELMVTIVPRLATIMPGRAARVTRTAASRLTVSEWAHCSSVMARKPSSRGVTAPTLLMRTSTGPCRSAATTSSSGPVGLDRSTGMLWTFEAADRRSSSGLDARAPAVTYAPSPISARVMASPIPLLAPVTTACLPVRPVSIASQPVLGQPVEAGLRDVRPAPVDDQGVAPVGELDQVGDGAGVPVLLEGGFGDGFGHGVVLTTHDEEQRSPLRVVGV